MKEVKAKFVAPRQAQGGTIKRIPAQGGGFVGTEIIQPRRPLPVATMNSTAWIVSNVANQFGIQAESDGQRQFLVTQDVYDRLYNKTMRVCHNMMFVLKNTFTDLVGPNQNWKPLEVGTLTERPQISVKSKPIAGGDWIDVVCETISSNVATSAITMSNLQFSIAAITTFVLSPAYAYLVTLKMPQQQLMTIRGVDSIQPGKEISLSMVMATTLTTTAILGAFAQEEVKLPSDDVKPSL